MCEAVKMEKAMDPIQRGMREFLSELPLADVIALSKTTAPLISVGTMEGAINNILKYSDAQTLLHRRKVTKKVIATYLDAKGLSISINYEKSRLVQMVIAYWDRGDTTQVLLPDKKEAKPLLTLTPPPTPSKKMKVQPIPFYFTPSPHTISTPKLDSKLTSTIPPVTLSNAVRPATQVTQVVEDKYLNEPAPPRVVNRTTHLINKTTIEAASPSKVAFVPPSQPAQSFSTSNANLSTAKSVSSATTTTSTTTITVAPKAASGPVVATATPSSLVAYIEKPELIDCGIQTDPPNEYDEDHRIMRIMEDRDRLRQVLRGEMITQQLGMGWCNWWYERLNSLQDFGPQHFFIGATVRIEYIRNGISDVNEVLWNGSKGATDLVDFRRNSGITFVPSLIPVESGGGLQAKMSPHGLAQIMVAGMIHDDKILQQGPNRTEDSVKGVFEQVFGIMPDPMEQGNYKVKYTLLRVKDELTLALMDDKDISNVDDSVNLQNELFFLEDFD